MKNRPYLAFLINAKDISEFSRRYKYLQYVFQQTLNLDYLGPWGHVQAIDSFISPQCSNLATPGTIKQNLQASGPSYRNCYSFLGPNQPGVNSPDPSSPGACPPDPGGQPPYAPGGSSPMWLR